MRYILVVDDDVRHDKMMSFLLISKGFEVEYALSGDEALEKLKSGKITPPDLILLDIMMPKMDGLETLAGLKKEDALKAIPVIMLTAVADPEKKEVAIGMGANDYISKPFSPSNLIERINKVLA